MQLDFEYNIYNYNFSKLYIDNRFHNSINKIHFNTSSYYNAKNNFVVTLALLGNCA